MKKVIAGMVLGLLLAAGFSGNQAESPQIHTQAPAGQSQPKELFSFDEMVRNADPLAITQAISEQ